MNAAGVVGKQGLGVTAAVLRSSGTAGSLRYHKNGSLRARWSC